MIEEATVHGLVFAGMTHTDRYGNATATLTESRGARTILEIPGSAPIAATGDECYLYRDSLLECHPASSSGPAVLLDPNPAPAFS